MTAGARLRTVTDDERRRVSVRLGDTFLTLGEYEAAFAQYRRARRLADHLDDVDLMRKQGIVRDRQGSLATATQWYERCLRRLPRRAGTDREREVRMKTALAYAAARHRQGRFDECLAWARRAEADARHLGDDASLASALDRLHVAATYLKRADAERYGPEALSLHQRLGDHLSTARILDNMGIQAYFAYDWSTALEYYGRAAEEGARAGDVIEANLGRANAAEVLSDQGHFDRAEAEFADVLRNWTASGWVFGAATAESNLALTRGRRGDTDRTTTIAVLDKVLDIFKRLGAEEFVAETMVRLAEVATHHGLAEDALAHVDRSLRRIADEALICRLERHRGLAHLLSGRTELALGALEVSVRLAERSEARYDQALAGALLAHVTDDHRVRASANALIDELGVVTPPAAFRLVGLDQFSS